ncbi:MAG: hypothetical protein FWC68_06030 [Oscillospiraceae bacterium]|nr:hypothetical protein [Oscillospiraceae bacterium]
MFRALLERIKHPITLLREKSAREPIRRATVYGIITMLVYVLLNILTVVQATVSTYTRKNKRYKDCTSAELWSMRWNAIRKRQLVESPIEEQQIKNQQLKSA